MAIDKLARSRSRLVPGSGTDAGGIEVRSNPAEAKRFAQTVAPIASAPDPECGLEVS